MSTSLSYAATGFGVFACVVVTVFTALAHAPSVPFFWHPITMSLSFLFFMVQGVLALVGKDSIVHVAFELAERKLKIDVHYYLQVRYFRYLTPSLGCFECNSTENVALNSY